MLHAKFEFTAEQVLAFGSGGPTILPAVEGHYYRVAHGTWLKRAGNSFTLANSGHYVQVQYENNTHTPANNFLVAGAMDTTGEGSSTGNPASISQLTTGGIGGVGLRMGVNAGGSYTGTGEECILDLFYWLLPATAEALDAQPTTELP